MEVRDRAANRPELPQFPFIPRTTTTTLENVHYLILSLLRGIQYYTSSDEYYNTPTLLNSGRLGDNLPGRAAQPFITCSTLPVAIASRLANALPVDKGARLQERRSMMDLSTTPINGVAPLQPIAQYPSPDSVQSTIKRKRVESSEDEAQLNGNAPQEVRDNIQGANIQEQVAELVAVLQRYADPGLLSSQEASSRRLTQYL